MIAMKVHVVINVINRFTASIYGFVYGFECRVEFLCKLAHFVSFSCVWLSIGVLGTRSRVDSGFPGLYMEQM